MICWRGFRWSGRSSGGWDRAFRSPNVDRRHKGHDGPPSVVGSARAGGGRAQCRRSIGCQQKIASRCGTCSAGTRVRCLTTRCGRGSSAISRPPCQRRYNAFRQARDVAEFPCVSLDTDARSRFQEGFLHFAFIVGPKEFPAYEGNQLGFPFGSPFLPKPLLPDVLESFLFASIGYHRIIDRYPDRASMWLPGTLRVPFSFNGVTS